MNISLAEIFSLLTALSAILMVGSRHIRMNIQMYSAQTTLLAIATALYAVQRGEHHLYAIAVAIFILKAITVPNFLIFIVHKVNVERDSGTMVPTPIAMHLSLGFLAISYMLSGQLPANTIDGSGTNSATAAISLVFTGLIVMLTRRIALSQIIGFLIMENGIYLFGLSQTQGMPMLVETGILLDVLAGVMIAGLIAFRIKKNFDHIDVTMLAELKE